MGKQFRGFVMGFIFACLLVVPTTALADNIQPQFNTVNLTVDGKSSAKQGENYQLSDGSQVPFSINYKGTTYISIRKISELLGVEINYDNTSKTVQVVTNSNNTKAQEKPTASTATNAAVSVTTKAAVSATTKAAVTYTTSYSVFNECTKAANSNGDKVTHVVGFKDGSKLDTDLDYSYYKTISSKKNSAQMWETKSDSNGNITKVNAISASKSGKVESSDSRNSVTLSTGTYNLEKSVVIYQWTEDKEHKLYGGNLKANDYVNLYDIDGNKTYDVVIFSRNGETLSQGDATTNKDTTESSTTNSNDKSSTSKANTKAASTGYSVINKCTKAANDNNDKIQNIRGYMDGTKIDALTSEQNIVKDWTAPKVTTTGFSNSAVYKLSLDSNGVIISAEKVSEDIGQGTAESADARNSVTISGKTYNLSDDALTYKVTDDDEYNLYNGDLKDNDIVQLYDTDSSKDGYEIVVFSRPKK